MTRRVSTAAARKDFASLLRDSAHGTRIKLTRYDKTIAVMISAQDLAKLEDCIRQYRSRERYRPGSEDQSG